MIMSGTFGRHSSKNLLNAKINANSSLEYNDAFEGRNNILLEGDLTLRLIWSDKQTVYPENLEYEMLIFRIS